MNLLKETKEDIEQNGQHIDNIIFIGSENSGHQCTWLEFEKLADFSYDDGFGSQCIGYDLIIVFNNNEKMVRFEYDGSEQWQFLRNFTQPKENKKIKCLGGDRFMCDCLAEINESFK